MKKILIFTLVLLFAVLSVIPASAASEKDFVVDNAGLLTDSEERELESLFAEIGDKWEYDIVVYTVDAIGVYSAHVYAEQFFDGNGYGKGDNADGAILLVSMAERDWGVFGTEMTDTEAEAIGESIMPYLSSGDYFRAFESFAYEIDDYKTFPFLKNLAVSLVISFVIAFIVVTVMKGKLKSVRNVDHAREYVRSGSFKLVNSRDLYLYSTVNRIARPKNNSSSRSGGGGGSRGGGASGKF